MAKNMLFVFSPTDPKILSEDTHKCQNLSRLLTLHKPHTQLLLFWFQLAAQERHESNQGWGDLGRIR
jgi:hypothetical protein